jgi:predicted Zn-dependent protease
VLTSLRGQRAELSNRAEGPALNQVARMLDETKLGERLKRAGETTTAPADAAAALKLIVESRIAGFKNQPQAVLERAEKLVKIRPDNPLFLEQAAVAKDELKQDREAEALFRAALKRSPSSREIRSFYAQFLSERNRDDEAMEILQALKAEEPRQSNWAILMCNILRKKKDHEHCIELLQQALKTAPRDARLFAYLGQEQRDSGKFEQAAESLRKSVDLDGRQPLSRFMLGTELERVGQFDQAEAQYREMLKLFSDDVLSHFGMAKFLANHRTERLVEAAREAEIAASLPERPGRPAREFLQNMVRQLRARAATQATTRSSSFSAPRSTSMPSGNDVRM